jgi:uncharacterized protein
VPGLGSLSRIIVENMQEQYQEFVLAKGRPRRFTTTATLGIGTVVVAPGVGLHTVFQSLGASAVVSGGQTMNPSTEELLKAVESVNSDEIIILPNNKNIVMTAEQTKALVGKKVSRWCPPSAFRRGSRPCWL